MEQVYLIDDFYGSILFLDIKNFLGVSDILTPAETFHFTQKVIRPLADVVLRHEGHICQIQGDAIIAIFGHLDHTMNDHAKRAVLCALQQQDVLKELNPVRIRQHKIPLAGRNGICTGELFAAYSDVSGKIEYTLAGKTINIASRLQKINKRYDTNILIDASVNAYIQKEIVTRKLDVVHLEGCSNTLPIYEVLFLHSEQQPETMRQKETYEQGLEYYFQERWEEAINCFNRIGEDKASYLMLERCKKRISAPVRLSSDGKDIK